MKRYECERDDGGHCAMVASDSGDWVRFEDVPRWRSMESAPRDDKRERCQNCIGCEGEPGLAHSIDIAAALRTTAAAEYARGAAEERGRWVAILRRELAHYRDIAAHATDWIEDRAATRAAYVCKDVAAAMSVTLDAEPGSGGEHG